ncbi:hypothetical protein L2E82_22661 [Cichorium intybus]|uniref:Uncharacterized protein n=1 Tax=Cichorium intybus TaxID=13427 RepID=A0ACB9DZD2_CICIN|nr:hypothetical protein L2E82_22661 [Cichorium intybus]
MSCCFGSKDPESIEQDDSPVRKPGPVSSQADKHNQQRAAPASATTAPAPINTNEAREAMGNSARNFGFREMAIATKNFRRECLIGESAFGKVYKGTLQGTGQVVAVKQLDRHGTKANKDFLVEVMRLSHLQHPNLVQLIGYCADGDQRILVYEYMQMGGLKDHLHEVSSEGKPLDWITRMKIASGSAEALEYLHEKANPPILYRNFKSSNIMLDENLSPKLIDYGLMKLQIDSGNTMHQRIMGSVGCAPEYEQNGELTPKSDVYGFGIVLLELITGRKALDTSLPNDEQNVVTWAQPYFREPKRFPEMADPQLQGAFPERSLNQAIGVAAMCVQEEPSVRPLISDVVAALSFLTIAPPLPKTAPAPAPNPTPTSNNDPHEEPTSSSSSREKEHEHEAASSQNDGIEEISYSDSEEEYEQNAIGNNNNNTEYDEDGDDSWSSESLYNEDDYGEDESQQEETSYRSKSKPKSIKRKVTFQTESRNRSRNSSKRSSKSFKTHSDNSLRKKSVNRKSSRNKRVDESLSKKSHDVFKDDESSSEPNQSNNKSNSRSNSKNNMSSSLRISESKNLHILESSDSSFSSSSDESNRRIVTFN